MIRKGFLIDTMKFTVIRDCEYDVKLVEGLFYKVDGQLIPSAYVFPIENKEGLEIILADARRMKKQYDDYVANLYYKVLPRFRVVDIDFWQTPESWGDLDV
jgi:hypothetical protein